MNKPRFVATAIKIVSIAALSALYALAAAAPEAGFVSGRFGLELDGNYVGRVSAVVSSDFRADTKSDPKDLRLNQHFVIAGGDAKLAWQLIEFRCSSGMRKAIYDWIAAEAKGDYTLHSGAILLMDSTDRTLQRLEFTDAAWKLANFSGATRGSTDSGVISLSISPKTASVVDVTKSASTPHSDLDLKNWVDGRFSFSLNDFDCSQVEGTAALVIRGKIVDTVSGKLVDSPGGSKTGVMALQVYVPMSQFPPYDKWLIAEKAGGKMFSRPGTLSFLDAKKNMVFSFSFPGFGILKITKEPLKGNDATAREATRYNAELGFEHVDFSYGVPALGP